MSYKDHLANRPPSLYSVRSKIFLAVEGALAICTYLGSLPWMITLLGVTALILGPLYVLTLLACLLVLGLSKKAHRGLFLAICILLALPILTFITFLILVGTGVVPVC